MLLSAALFASSCGNREPKAPPANSLPEHLDAGAAPDLDTPVLSSAVAVGTLPHDRTAFTEGLAFWQGRLFESTGLYGESVVRELDPGSGKELRRARLDDRYFGEGITILNGRLYQLTWREHMCLIYDAASFHKLAELTYDGEGWGITNDGRSLITSDGSEWLRYRDPASFAVTRSIQVTLAGRPIEQLNELEYIHDEIWANVWHGKIIVRISPADGRVVAVVDASTLVDSTVRSSASDDVLNGIAFDTASGSLLITGKRWPVIYKLALPTIAPHQEHSHGD
jgi:glutamine cyclotransferase